MRILFPCVLPSGLRVTLSNCKRAFSREHKRFPSGFEEKRVEFRDEPMPKRSSLLGSLDLLLSDNIVSGLTVVLLSLIEVFWCDR